jgi:hypothetical protein
MTKRKTKPTRGRSAGSLHTVESHSAESLREGSAVASNVLATHAVQITRALVTKATAGNMNALRLCIERLVPLSRERVLPVKIPAAQDALQITVALQAVFDGLGAGHLTAGEAQKLAALLENQRKAIETSDLEERLQALESGSRSDNSQDRPYLNYVVDKHDPNPQDPNPRDPNEDDLDE